MPKPKRITRKFYTEKFRIEVNAIIEEVSAKERSLFPMLFSARMSIQNIRNISSISSDGICEDSIKKLLDLAEKLYNTHVKYKKYASAEAIQDRHEKYKKYTSYMSSGKYYPIIKEIVEIMQDANKQYRKFTSNEAYSPIVRELVELLRDEDDKDEWGNIYQKQLKKLLQVRDEVRERYYYLVEIIRDITYTLREIYKEEERRMKDMEDNLSVEECVAHLDEIRHMIYEKCANGEITLTERENMLQDLTAMVLFESVVEDVFENAVDAYVDGNITTEEFDNILDTIYEEYPSYKTYILEEPVGSFYDMFHENVNHLYQDKLITLTEAKERSSDIDQLFEAEFRATYGYTESGDPVLTSETAEKLQALKDGYSNMLESITDALESQSITVEESDVEVAKCINTYCEQIRSIVMTEEDDIICESASISEKEVDHGISNMVRFMAIKVGSVIPSALRRRNAKQLVKIYEGIKDPKIKKSDLKIKSIDLSELTKHDSSLNKFVSGKSTIKKASCAMAYYQEKPFLSVAAIEGIDANKKKNIRLIVKSYTSDAKKHEQYYASIVTLLKTSLPMTNDLKIFVREMIYEAKIIQREIQNSKKFVEENTMDYDKDFMSVVESKIYEKYENGEINLDQKEELLLQLRSTNNE